MSSTKMETRNRILETTWQLLEAHPDQSVRMQDIAKAAGVSRQAVYLHFESRVELLIATARYVDQVRDLDERLGLWRAAATAVAQMEAYVEFWGNYAAEVYAIAKALLAVYDVDADAAAAWDDRMNAIRLSCGRMIKTLDEEERLAPEWTREEATELFWTLLSIRNWEQLTVQCGWSIEQYVERMQTLVKRTFVRDAGEGEVCS